MTVSYNLDVSSTSFIGFVRLQLRWRGSIWKSVLRELSIFTVFFAVITYIYRTEALLSPTQRRFWDNMTALIDEKLDYIPLTFMLGFFVTIVVGRWGEIFNNMGWIDPSALLISTYIRGSDEKSRILRRNIIRYMVLTQVLIFRDISMQVRKRFPTLETVVAAGLLLEHEKEKLNELQCKYTKYFQPIQWIYSLIFEARNSGKIGSDLMMNESIKVVREFRDGLAKLCNFDWVPIPLVYPQVVFLAVRSYFFLCLIGRQSVLIDGEPPKEPSAVYPVVPFLMTALQFVFYVGWMKVAENLMNPLGEDDDDFECNFLIDRNLAVGFTIVDAGYAQAPRQERDIFWTTSLEEPLYSEETASRPVYPQVGSVANVQLPPKTEQITMMPHVKDAQEDDAGNDEVEGYGDKQKLLSRTVSVVSVNKVPPSIAGSRQNLARKGLLDTAKKYLSRDGRTRTTSDASNWDGGVERPNLEITAANSVDIINELASEALVPSPLDESGPLIPPQKSPIGGVLHSVAEDDENEHQKTLKAEDLERLKRRLEEEQKNQEARDKKD